MTQSDTSEWNQNFGYDSLQNIAYWQIKLFIRAPFTCIESMFLLQIQNGKKNMSFVPHIPVHLPDKPQGHDSFTCPRSPNTQGKWALEIQVGWTYYPWIAFSFTSRHQYYYYYDWILLLLLMKLKGSTFFLTYWLHRQWTDFDMKTEQHNANVQCSTLNKYWWMVWRDSPAAKNQHYFSVYLLTETTHRWRST